MIKLEDILEEIALSSANFLRDHLFTANIASILNSSIFDRVVKMQYAVLCEIINAFEIDSGLYIKQCFLHAYTKFYKTIGEYDYDTAILAREFIIALEEELEVNLCS